VDRGAKSFIQFHAGLHTFLRECGTIVSEDFDKTAIASPSSPEEPNKSGDSERRVQQRFSFTADAEVIELHSQARVTGRCSDLGPGGCYVDTLAPFAVGAEVRIRLSREMREFSAAAIVTYAQVPLGMGLRFVEIPREHQDLLNSWIAELSGGRPAAGSPAGSESASTNESTNMMIVLNQLIALLVRKKILTENEGAGFLRRMFR
jgi:hypothetical protein